MVVLYFQEASCRDPLTTPDRTSGVRTLTGNGYPDSEGAPHVSKGEMGRLLPDPNRWASIRLGINVPAWAERTVRRTDCEALLVGEPTRELYDVILFFR